jgi:hypothetical protein
MNRPASSKKQRILPLWLHFVSAGVAGVLFLGFLIVRSGGFEARAQSFLEAMAQSASPILNAQAMLGRRTTESPQGSYTLNGMRVKYFTVGAAQGGGKALIQLENLMARTGYVHRILTVQGVPTLVGIHPETKMMLTARPGRDLRGFPVVRLSQQDLSELREDFQAEISGVPMYPGASGKMLISSDEGPKSDSLMYSAGGTAEDIGRYYVAGMKAEGWSPIPNPAAALGVPMTVLFFAREGQEASVLLAEIPGSAASLVLVTVGASHTEVG